MASGPGTSWQIEGEKVEAVMISSSWALKSLRMVTAAMKLEDDCFLAGKLWQTIKLCIKKQKHHFDDKGSYNQGCGLSISYVWMCKLDRKEGKVPKNWCFWTVVL